MIFHVVFMLPQFVGRITAFILVLNRSNQGIVAKRSQRFTAVV